jgi:hypothetical protein
MLRGVFAKGEEFFELLSQEIDIVQEGAKKLVEMMENPRSLESSADSIKEVENQGDEITAQIVRKLDQVFITPIDREDLHTLAIGIDDILDLIEAASSRIILFKIPASTEAALGLAKLIDQAVIELKGAINQLGKNKNNDKIFDHCEKINQLEEDADQINREAIANLFENEENPITVIKWYQVYDFLEEAMDRSKNLAGTLASIVLKHS